MSLSSFYFPFFLTAVLILLLLVQLAGKILRCEFARAQILALLSASYVFIGIAGAQCCAVIFLVTILTYFCAVRISAGKDSKVWTVISITFLLLALAYFKYMNFFIGTLGSLFGRNFPLLNVFLPTGISFYIFTAIAYTVDVYKKEIPAEHNFIDFALFISFFPKIISGPIVRSEDFLPQVKKYGGISSENLKTGIQIFVFGLFKKIVLADHLAVFVDDVFQSPPAFSSFTVILAVFSYSLQIYFDFSGYSDMAVGASKILGFEVKPNFNLPYLASSPSDFWRRWHISLSSWFRDYLYFPLGGSRRGIFRTNLNLVFVMMISGLWHGAGRTFVLWGLLHGIFSCAGRLLTGVARKIPCGRIAAKRILHSIGILATFFTVSVLWIFFRAEDFSKAFVILKICFVHENGVSQPYTWSFFAAAILLAAGIAAKIKSGKDGAVNGYYPLVDLSRVGGLSVFLLFCGLTIVLGYYGDTAFIYGKF